MSSTDPENICAPFAKETKFSHAFAKQSHLELVRWVDNAALGKAGQHSQHAEQILEVFTDEKWQLRCQGPDGGYSGRWSTYIAKRPTCRSPLLALESNNSTAGCPQPTWCNKLHQGGRGEMAALNVLDRKFQPTCRSAATLAREAVPRKDMTTLSRLQARIILVSRLFSQYIS